MVMMTICFSAMIDRRKIIGLISSRHHNQGFSPLKTSDIPRLEIKFVQDLRSDFANCRCVAVVTTTPRHYILVHC